MKFKKNYKRLVAYLLLIVFLVPNHIISLAGESGVIPVERERYNSGDDIFIEETEADRSDAVETIPDTTDIEEKLTTDHQEDSEEVTLAAEDEQDDWDGLGVIYWNPGGSEDGGQNYNLATSSYATRADVESSWSGSDHADGLTPKSAVKSLNTAIRKAEKLSRRMNVEISEITVYAMNPMVIPQDTLYTVRGRGVSIVPWEGRAYDNDLIFIINGGRLMLSNVRLQPADGGITPEDAALIYITAGALQLGGKVESDGNFILDYSLEKPVEEWSSPSDADATGSEAERYYEPVIELMKHFDMYSGFEYMLDLIVPADRENVAAVKSLYSDTTAPEEFMDTFEIIDREDKWRLIVEERVGGVLRDTTEEGQEKETASEATVSEIRRNFSRQADVELTQKTLVAARGMLRNDTQRKGYWNPGGVIHRGGGEADIPAGDDGLFDGTDFDAPKKTFAQALAVAGPGGRVICMQTLDLSNPDAADYLGPGSVDGDGNYVLAGFEENTITLSAWSGMPRAILRIPDDQKALLKNLNLSGITENPGVVGGQLFLCDGGQLTLEKNIKFPKTADDQPNPGYIQINLSEETNSKDNPLIVNDATVEANLFFDGINNNLEWRYLNVVISGPNLLAVMAGDKITAGQYLKDNIHLSVDNSTIFEDGGSSQFAWILRPDTMYDDRIDEPDQLELYATYYYDGVYINGKDGDDGGIGATCIYPVETFSRALEILDIEMGNSLTARAEARDKGLNWQSINVPRYIYVCDTVYFSGVENWEIPDYQDIDNTPIEVQVVTHLEGVKDENDIATHQAPDILFHISGSATDLTLGKNILVKNVANKATTETYGFIIDGGAKVTLTANADVSGLSLPDPENPGAVQKRTLGTHFLLGKNPDTNVITSGNLVMTDSWTGSIHHGQYGIYAYGEDSRIDMGAGSITEHHNRHTLDNDNQDTAGVYLKDGKMSMSGGIISNNYANLSGAGVYLDGNAEFTMTKGTIQGNRALYLAPTAVNDTTWLATQLAQAKGVGVYVGETSTFTMGVEGNTDHTECVIADQYASALPRGIGVFVDNGASFYFNSGTISGNKGRGSRHNNLGNNYENDSKGGGICGEGLVIMKDGLVTDNGWTGEWHDDFLGGGIYLEGHDSKILGGVIANNRSNTWGGGLCIGDIGLAAEYEISDVIFKENNTNTHGGGMAAFRYTTGAPAAKVIMKDSQFLENIARSCGGGLILSNVLAEVDHITVTGNSTTSDHGGGLYVQYNYNVSVPTIAQNYTNCLIENNTANQHGGGVYIDGSCYFVDTVVKDNQTRFYDGGGIYVNTRKVHSKGLQVLNNTAARNGGGIYIHTTDYQYHYGLVVDGNGALQNGGGIYTNSGSRNPSDAYTDVEITNNTAGINGGGIFKGGSCYMSLSETVPGKTKITGNKAVLGGGIYTQANDLLINIAGPIQNEASRQGHNLYIPNNISTYIHQGEFLNPDDASEDTYSVYIASEGRSQTFLDPLKVNMPGPNSFYINSPDNWVFYLQEAGTVTPPKLNVCVNPERFTAGNIVIRPYGNTTIKNFTSYTVNLDGLGVTAETITYPRCLNAATPEGLEYAKGGKLTPRTILADAVDPDYAARTNIVLLGKGVYLDGVNGIDGRDGTTPGTAVKTFNGTGTLAGAMDRLEEYTDESNTDADDDEGFPPFIYICGTVTIDSDETWEIDIDQSRYTSDSKYRTIELAASRVPELPQIKRYTGFLKTPMVKVKGSGTTLTIPELIMDGMMHSVDKAKQGNGSLMIDVEDATLVLKDKANIRNNNLNMIKVVRGTVKLDSQTPDSDDFKNLQVEVTRGDGVDLDQASVMTMTGYATIHFPNKPLSLAGDWAGGSGQANHGRGVILRGGSDLTMSNHSKITAIDSAVTPNNIAIMGVVMGNQTDINDICNLVMENDAMISGMSHSISLHNYDVAVTLRNQAELKDNANGIYTDRAHDGGTILLTDQASIYSSGEIPNWYLNSGLYISNGGSQAGKLFDIQMLKDSLIKNTNYGIYYRGRTNNVNIEMHNNAAVTGLINNSYGGIDVRDMTNINSTVNVAMHDDSHIEGDNWRGRGIFFSNIYGHLEADMNDQAYLDNLNEGYYLHLKRRYSARLSMNNDSNITCVTNGFAVNDVQIIDADQKVELIMTDDSWICGTNQNNSYGIHINNLQSKIGIYMKERAKVFDFNEGVRADGLKSPYLFSMEGDTWIGASATGKMIRAIAVYHASQYNEYNVDLSGRYQFRISGNAQLGGDGPMDSDMTRRGVTENLIYANMPIDMEVSGNAKLAYAGINGVLFNPGTATWLQGTCRFVLAGDASLAHTKQYGIFTETVLPVDITIKDQAAVTDTAYGNDFRGAGPVKVSVLGHAHLGVPANSDPRYYTVKLLGQLVLDGTTTIDGIIYLRDGNQPIILSAPVPAGDPEDKYRLQLVEGYVGQKVVVPDGTVVPDATPYRKYFKKELGEGLANDKNLVNLDVNIILQGENNVYISSRGVDTNNGVTPATSVRTFARAKELLEEEGFFTEGANIIVCYSVPGSTNYNDINGYDRAVTVLAGDEDWSFDEGGYVTNRNSGDTWRPRITRDVNFWGRMIDINPNAVNAASQVEFKNVTIDSYAMKGDNANPNEGNWKAMIMLLNGGTATLGKGAILENNRTNNLNANAHTGTLGVYVQQRSTLIMDGGTIRNLVHENLYSDNDSSIAVTNEGIFEFRDGSIENCKITQRNNYATNNKFSIVLNRSNGTVGNFIMTGGTIQDNEIAVKCDVRGGFAGALAFIYAAPGSIRGGSIINNKGGRGSGLVVYGTGKVEIERGTIRGNKTVFGALSTGTQSPIYIAGNSAVGPDFNLKGGGAALDDPIYLFRKDGLITVSSDIYQVNRRYKVYVNFNDNGIHSSYWFGKGSAVVQPDGQGARDVSQYLLNFELYAGNYILDRGQSATKIVGTKNRFEDKCLILMQAVFLNSAKSDSNDGKTPETAVKTFAKAKSLGQGTNLTSPVKDYFVIYISGMVTPAAGETWQLADESYMCRYTGFTVYDANNEPVKEKTPTYRGYLIEVEKDFTLNGARIYGRRGVDTTASNGESIIRALPDSHVVLSGGTLANNANDGVYLDEYNRPVSLTMKGGAVVVEVGGVLEINDIKMMNTVDGNKAAIYLKAEEVLGSENYGQVILKNSPYIQDGIYLSGKAGMAQAYIKADKDYIPVNQQGANSTLRVYLENDFSERPVIKYLDDFVPGRTQIEYYKMDDSILAIYDITNRTAEPSIIELQLRQVLYVGGQGSSDGNSGLKPDEALATFCGVYQKLAATSLKGANVYVVGTIEIEPGVNYTLINEEYTQSDQTHYQGIYRETDTSNAIIRELETSAQVYFKRYSKPHSTTVSGYEVDSHLGSLIQVNDGANLALMGIYLDGHSQENVSKLDYLSAPGVDAEAPLITVMPGGYLESGYSVGESTSGGLEPPKVGLSTSTLFTSNTNVNEKTAAEKIGENAQGLDVIEGIGAGIEILSNSTKKGTVLLKRTNFRNLTIGDNMAGGSDIYQNGTLIVQEETSFTGSVFLEGLGDYVSQNKSHVIDIGVYGTPVSSPFKVLMRDPYKHRPVIAYPSGLPSGPSPAVTALYLMGEDVNGFYKLEKRAYPEGYILELIIPQAVYVDGQNGDDNNTGTIPESPVKTLKKAYEILKESGGKVVYIVDMVEISENIQLSSSEYNSVSAHVQLPVTTDHIDIRRYVKPLAGINGEAGYQVPTYTKTLFKLTSGSAFIINEQVTIDGHYSKRNTVHDGTDVFVDTLTLAEGPLFELESGAELELNEGVSLINNHNRLDIADEASRIKGGAIHNKGRVLLDGAVINGNDAEYGAGIYQDGTFELMRNVKAIENQEIYLTTVNTGTDSAPVWGADRIIDTAVWIEDTDLMQVKLNMDHAVAGRPVVKYMYDSDVDPQHVYYDLGRVPDTLFLVQSKREDSDNLLELQDWRVLDVNVPKEIFLVVRQFGGQITARDAKSSEPTLGNPVYTITNNGRYDAAVFVSGFTNDNVAAGITHDEMTLVNLPSQAIGDQELYLAIKGYHPRSGEAVNPFDGSPETSLYNFDVDGVHLKELGTLEAGAEGKFEFVALASKDFIAKYEDTSFPFYGANATAEARVAHIRHEDHSSGVPVTSANEARAKYKMTYRIKITPPRR